MGVRDNDGRKIDHKSLEILRLRSVEQMLGGVRPDDVAVALGLSRATVYGWLASYREGGRQALLARPVPGRPPAISRPQMDRLWALIADSSPRERQLGSALWTVESVRKLIFREFGISPSAVTVRRLLLKMGVSAQWPVIRAGRCTGAHERWLAPECSATRAQAEAEGAVIYFGGEKVIQPDVGRPGADTAEQSGPWRRPATVIFAITARTGPCFAVHDGPPSATAFKGFCARLLRDVPGLVYLVMDGQPDYLEPDQGDAAGAGEGRLRLLFLPPQATEPPPGAPAEQPAAQPVRLWAGLRWAQAGPVASVAGR